MEYKKILNENYTLHLVNTDRFKSINIVVFLTKKFDKKDIIYGNLLCKNMVYTSKKYNTKNKMAIIGEELYGASISSSFGINANAQSYIFSLDFLNPIYTENIKLEDYIDFLCEILFKPNIKNNEFDNKYFNITKNELINKIKSIKDNPNMFSSIEYAKIMYKSTPSAYSIYPTLKQASSITSNQIYKEYKKLFDGSYKIDIIVHGDVNIDIAKIIQQKFKNVKSTKKKIKFEINHTYDKNIQIKTDSLNFNQSKLYMGYRLNNMNDYEIKCVLKVYNTILGTMNDSILFNVVREENSLCYTISSYYSRYNKSLTIYSGINKNNYDKTVALIKKCVESMSNKKVISRLFESAKKTINTYLNNYYDDVASQINNYYYKEFETLDDIETLRDKINKVTIDEIISLNNKISLSVIYLLKGENSSEEKDI